jgi:hypothetical protein
MAKKPKNPFAIRITTPAAPAVFPKLDLANPDYGSTQYPIKGGAFSCQQRFVASDPAVAAMLKKMTAALDAFEAEAQAQFDALPVAARKKIGGIKRADFVNIQYDEEENETGEIIIKFKMGHSGTTKAGKEWKRYPQLIDAKLQPIKKGTAIWGGSTVRISADIVPYFKPADGEYGISRFLEGVQVIELVSAGGRSAKDMGFDEEDGYEAANDFHDESSDDEGTNDKTEDKTPAGSDDF